MSTWGRGGPGWAELRGRSGWGGLGRRWKGTTGCQERGTLREGWGGESITHVHMVPGRRLEEEKMVQRELCACAHSSRERDGGQSGPEEDVCMRTQYQGKGWRRKTWSRWSHVHAHTAAERGIEEEKMDQREL